MVYDRDGTVRTFADGFFYCNGIAFEPDGTVVVVERRGLQRVYPDGSREWVIEKLGRGRRRRLLPRRRRPLLRRVDDRARHPRRRRPTARSLDFLEIDGEGLTTNCCFGGDDLRTLFVADAIPGNLVAFEGMPTPGLAAPDLARSRVGATREVEAHCSGSSSGQPCSGRSKYSTLSLPR